jgi:hypothetical protein
MMQSFYALDEVEFDDDYATISDDDDDDDDDAFDPESRVVRVEDYLAGRGLDIVRARRSERRARE